MRRRRRKYDPAVKVPMVRLVDFVAIGGYFEQIHQHNQMEFYMYPFRFVRKTLDSDNHGSRAPDLSG